ncbi:hypothetical protein E3G68_005027 [Mycobacteroides abscessus]|uniref:hypothetical protein n=1 Tax=Mycobacteroides abscessus TaxID=36809 RepID=UPI001877DC6B|nr:hypothetical protein [Mycobacteroides abscessus]
MIEKPASPHDLIGDHWPEIDELGIAKVAAALAKAGTGAGTAEQKSYQDGTTYQTLLPEGFETQVDAAFKVGGMAADLSGWFTKCATETGVVAEGVAQAKLLIAVTTMVAEAVIASKEAEIAALQLLSLRPEVRAQRVQQLRAEIKQITDDAKQAIQELYDGIYTPSAPAAPGLQPLVNNAPFGQKFSYGNVVPAGHGDVPATPLGNGSGETQGGKSASTQEGAQGTKSGPGSSDEANQGLKADSSSSQTQGEKSGSSPTGSNSELSNATQGAKPGSSPALDVQPAGATSSAPPVTAPPSTSAGSGASSVSSLGSSMPKMPSTPSAPSGGGLGGGSGLSGLGSGGGASASPASLNPTQQFLNGAAQGFSQSPVASAASAAAQPFRPPAGSTMQTSPAPLAPTTPAAGTPSVSAPQQVVTSSPSTPVAAGAPPMSAGAGGVPLAPPPTAGVPNAAPPSSVAPPPAAAAPPGGGGGGPVSGPPPGIMNLGGKNAALKAVQMGAHTVGEGLRSTPEFSAAMALVAALNAPRPVVTLGGWSCAVFGAGPATRFVVAERHGLSWIPAGMFLPSGLTVAHLDERVPADVRHSWRGLDPSVLVLAEYAKAIGEQPRIVVARAYHPGMPGWFGHGVVLAADESSHVIINNPLDEMGGPNGCRHRLEIADPESWRYVTSVPDEKIAEEIQYVAQWLVGWHNQMFEQWPEADADAKLRAAALAQMGRMDGTEEIKKLLAAKMTDLATRLIGTPNYGTPQWRVHTGTEMALRGWEALLLGLGKPTRLVLADMQYAVLMATQPVLPMPVEAAAAGA